MQRKEWQWHIQRCPHPQQTDMAEEMAPVSHSVRTLFGSTDQEILDVVKHVYRGQCKVAPSVLPCRLQDQLMAELHKELSKNLVRASLQSVMVTVWSLSRGRRHSQACSLSQARSPSVEDRRKEVAKQWLCWGALGPIAKDIEAELSSRVHHQSTNKQLRHLPRLPQDPTCVPHCLLAYHTHKQLCCSEQTLSTAPAAGIQEEGVSRMQPDSTLMHTTGCPHSPPGSVTECLPQGPAKKQFSFDLTKDLGDTPLLPNDLAGFFRDAIEQIDAHHPICSLGHEFPEVTLQWWWPMSWPPSEEPGQRPIPLHWTSLCLLVALEPGAQHHQTWWEGP